MLTGNGVKMTRNLYVLNSNKYSNSQITIDKKKSSTTLKKGSLHNN